MKRGTVYVTLYVDDNLMVGNVKDIDEETVAIKQNGLVLKILVGLQDNLSCEVRFLRAKKRAW